MSPSSTLSALLWPLLWVLFCCDRLSSESPASLGSRRCLTPSVGGPCTQPLPGPSAAAASAPPVTPRSVPPPPPPTAASRCCTFSTTHAWKPSGRAQHPGDSPEAGSASPRGPLCAAFAFGSQQVLLRHQSIDTNRFQLRQLSRANTRLLISLQNVSCAILKLFRMCSPARGVCQRQKGSRPPRLGGGGSRVT